MRPASERSPERVLVLTPTGRDAVMIEARLVAEGFVCELCAHADALLDALESDAGVALIAEEALSPAQAASLLARLEAQEPWSDVPLVFLTIPHAKRAPTIRTSVGLLGRANVMLLPRPIPVHLLISAVRSAVRARRRQYEMRELHRELERAVQLSELFVGILGHDLRSPLAAIRASAELIVQASEDARALRPAGRIVSASDRMRRMIEQLLDFARVRRGRGIALDVVDTDLEDVATPVLHELGDANPLARLDLVRAGDLAGQWDPDRIAQVVSNLVGNAIQHGDAAAPVRIELDGTKPATVCLSVTNVGAIPDERMPTLFEGFKRATTARTRGQGLGLGLFIAREIVRAHGGELTASVADGKTTFEATLPRAARPVETEVLTPA
ncbi:ATP-binding protein [Myxococcota bacterium]|nr:ATP-binding protein [Myxococcota bacterium]